MSALLLLALLGCNRGPQPPAAGPGKPVDQLEFDGAVPRNLLFLSIDTTRRDHISRYDPDERDLTPFLSGWMDAGFVADNHLSCASWTYAAMSCATLGTTPPEVGFLMGMSTGRTWPEDQPFLGNWLQEAGYATVLATANHMFSPELFNESTYQVTRELVGYKAEAIYDAGLEELDKLLEDGVDRWFLHLHFVDPHAAYTPPDEYIEGLEDLPPIAYDLDDRDEQYVAAWDDWPEMSQSERDDLSANLHARYEGELRWIDAQIGAAYVDLDRRGLLDDTLVVVFTDHGEQFWERGNQGHAFELNTEEVDAVWFLWAKNLKHGATTAPSSHVDIVPTILHLLGVEPPESVNGEVLGTSAEDRTRFAVVEARSGLQLMVDRNAHQLHYGWDGTGRYYDTDADPLQQDDLYDAEDPEVQELWELLQPLIEATEPLTDLPPPVAL